MHIISDVFFVLQLSQSSHDSAHFSVAKTSFTPLMQLDLVGIGMEATMRGDNYFDLHFGISSVELKLCELEEIVKERTKVDG
jgi:hypothetical protein